MVKKVLPPLNEQNQIPNISASGEWKAEDSTFLEKLAKGLKMGGDEAIEKQHKSGKLTVRERIELLFDKESFVEYGALATHQSKFEDMKK